MHLTNEHIEEVRIEMQYLAPIPFFALWKTNKKVVIEQYEHYTKGSFRNRCYIAGPNGILRLTIPLEKGKNTQQPIKEVRIANHSNWQMQHWRSIRSAYGKAPFFEYYADEIEPFYTNKYAFLFDFGVQLTKKIKEILEIPTKLDFSSSYELENESKTIDLRGVFKPPEVGDLTGIGMQQKPYAQVFGERYSFLPNLSIIDLIFCKGPEASLLLSQSLMDKKTNI